MKRTEGKGQKKSVIWAKTSGPFDLSLEAHRCDHKAKSRYWSEEAQFIKYICFKGNLIKKKKEKNCFNYYLD